MTDGEDFRPVSPTVGERNRRAPGGRKYEAKVRMTEYEAQMVRARAAALGVSVPRALLESTMGAPATTRTEREAFYRELMGLRRLLANLTNNVNQIARALNSDMEVPPREIRSVLERTAVAVRRIEELAEESRL